jgi:hypothetical protein
MVSLPLISSYVVLICFDHTGVVEAGEPPVRRSSSATGRSRLQDCRGPMSAEDGAASVEGGEPPVRRSPATGRCLLPDDGQQSAEDGVEEAGDPPRAAALRPAGACCRTAADSRVQKMVLPVSKPASPPCAAALQPADAGCRTAAHRV